MATKIGAFDAKNRLSQLLGEVERGERFVITRRGRPVACLCGVEDTDEGRPSDRTEALRRARRLRQAAKTGPETLRELIDEGR